MSTMIYQKSVSEALIFPDDVPRLTPLIKIPFHMSDTNWIYRVPAVAFNILLIMGGKAATDIYHSVRRD